MQETSKVDVFNHTGISDWRRAILRNIFLLCFYDISLTLNKEPIMNAKSFLILLIWISSLYNGFNKTVTAQVLDQDSLALVALYNSTAGGNWIDNTNWLSEPVSNWFGITVTEGRVTQINLKNNNLVGILPPEISDLKYLTELILQNNQISGSLPVEIGNLENLKKINLNNNTLSNTIPAEIGNLSNIESINLTLNQLSGSIPNEIGNLINLNDLSIGRNQLTGIIPPEIGNLTKLTYLFLSANHLSGTIPNEICNLTKLSNLYLNSNQLSGSIPSKIDNLTDLSGMYLNDNQLSDSIPAAIGNLANLSTLSLHENQLSGVLPAEISQLSNLYSLNVSNNQLTDSIPLGIGHLYNLVYMYLNDNQFTDLPDLSLDTSLTDLKIQNNKFTFEDIEPNLLVKNFIYSPQDSVGVKRDTTIAAGSNLIISVQVGGRANQYQWIKDGIDIPGANQRSYVLKSVDSVNEGMYTCKITNTYVTELTLYNRPVQVSIFGGTGIKLYENQNPKTFVLNQNFPNPFNTTTRINYYLQAASMVSLRIYNINGQEIITLVNEFQTAGEKTLVWGGLNEYGHQVPSGLYFYQIETESFTKIKKMSLLK
jgi:Leucine-rich repeat (LRR) protein